MTAINPMTNAILMMPHTGQSLTRAMNLYMRESYNPTFKSARCRDTADGDTGSECFNSGRTSSVRTKGFSNFSGSCPKSLLDIYAYLRRITKVEHFYYVPHPKDFSFGKVPFALQNWATRSVRMTRLGTDPDLKHYSLAVSCLPSITKPYQPNPSPLRFLGKSKPFYQTLPRYKCESIVGKVLTKLYHWLPIDISRYDAIMNTINKGGKLAKIH